MRQTLLWLALGALGCAQVQVTTHAEPGFGRFTTYAQAPAPHAPLVGERVHAGIAKLMQEKG
jgi:hypothetical protein